MIGSTVGQAGRRRKIALTLCLLLISGLGLGVGPESVAAESAPSAAAAAPAPSVVNIDPLPGSAVAARALVTLSISVVAGASFTSTTTPAPAPTGTVTVTSGNVPVGSGNLNAAGKLVLAVPADAPDQTGGLLSPGIRTFSAAYSGDATFASSSGSSTVTVYFNDYPPPRPGSSDQPFYRDIRWLTAQGITTGYSDGGFHPNAVVNRQAMAAFLYRAANPGEAAPRCTAAPFPDVPADTPFCAEIAWLSAAGIGTGFADGGFHPKVAVNRQAMAVLLYRFAHRGGPAPVSCTTAPFNDVSVGPEGSCAEITWMSGEGITSGYDDGGFHPDADVTRQSAAAFLHRLIGSSLGAKKSGTVIAPAATESVVTGAPGGSQTAVVPGSVPAPPIGGHLVLPVSSGAPAGLVGTVTAVAARPDGSRSVSTVPATLDEVYDTLHIVADKALTDPDVVDPNNPARAAATTGAFAAGLAKFVCSGATQPQVDVTLDMRDFRVNFDLELTPGRPSVTFTSSWSPILTTAVTFNGAVECTLKGDAIAGIRLPVSSTPPLELTVKPAFRVSAGGQIGLTLNHRMTITQGFTADTGGARATGSIGASADGSVQVGGNASIFGGIGATIALAGRTGVTGELGPQLGLRYDQATECLALDTALQARLTLSLDQWVRDWRVGLVDGPTARKVKVYTSCTGSGTVAVSLRWDNDMDEDLEVIEPDGTKIWSNNMGPSSTGGVLDRDDNVVVCLMDEEPGGAENVNWAAGSSPARGTYTVNVVEFTGCGPAVANWTVEVRINNQLITTKSGSAPASFTFKY